MMSNEITKSTEDNSSLMIDLDSDPKYTLEIDPEDKYKMTENQKEFVKNFVEFGSIPLAAKLCDIDEPTARSYYNTYSVKKEIERLNMALYQRRFLAKMFSIEQIGAYLSTQLTDEFVPAKDRLSSRDKLTVAKMILDIHKMKQEAINQPSYIDAIEVENQLKDLSVESIKSLINTSNNKAEIKENSDNKDQIIDALNEINKEENNCSLSVEEMSLMKSLDNESLLQILEKANGKGKNKDDK